MEFDHCFSTTKESKIKVEENGRKVVINNQLKEKYTKLKIDGCLIKQETASDWAISKKNSETWLSNSKAAMLTMPLTKSKHLSFF